MSTADTNHSHLEQEELMAAPVFPDLEQCDSLKALDIMDMTCEQAAQALRQRANQLNYLAGFYESAWGSGIDTIKTSLEWAEMEKKRAELQHKQQEEIARRARGNT